MSLRSDICPCFSSTPPILLYILTSWFITWALTSGSSLPITLHYKISLNTVGVKDLDRTQRYDNSNSIFHGKQDVGLILVLCASYSTHHIAYISEWICWYPYYNNVQSQRNNNLWYHKTCIKLFTLKTLSLSFKLAALVFKLLSYLPKVANCLMGSQSSTEAYLHHQNRNKVHVNLNSRATQNR